MPKAEAARSSLRVQTVAHAFTRDTLFRYVEAFASRSTSREQPSWWARLS